VDELVFLTMGSPEQLGALHERLREIGMPEATPDDEAWERTTGAPTPRARDSYERRRKEMILAMLDKSADRLDKAAAELGAFFDHLRQVGVRGFVAEHTGDSGYGLVKERPPGARRRK
jgi:hypothetical protein